MAGELIAVRLPHEAPPHNEAQVSVQRNLPPASRFNRTHVSRFMPRRKTRRVGSHVFQAVREDGQLTFLDERGYPLEPSEQDFAFLLWLSERKKKARLHLANEAARRIAKQGRALTLHRVMTVSEFMLLVKEENWLRRMGVAPAAWEYALWYARDMIQRGVLR